MLNLLFKRWSSKYRNILNFLTYLGNQTINISKLDKACLLVVAFIYLKWIEGVWI